jgi:hypothetical protein
MASRRAGPRAAHARHCGGGRRASFGRRPRNHGAICARRELFHRHASRRLLRWSSPSLFNSYDPRPWTLTDSMLVGLLMFRDLTDSLTKPTWQRGAILNLGADPAKFPHSFPLHGAGVNPGFERLGRVRRAHGRTASRWWQTIRTCVQRSGHLVSGAFESAGVECIGRFAAWVALRDQRAQREHCLGRHQSEADVLDVYAEQIDDAQRPLSVSKARLSRPNSTSKSITVKGGKPMQMRIFG